MMIMIMIMIMIVIIIMTIRIMASLPKGTSAIMTRRGFQFSWDISHRKARSTLPCHAKVGDEGSF